MISSKQIPNSQKKGFALHLFQRKKRWNYSSFFKKGEGFTLIEVVVAIFILSVGISAILVIFPSGLRIVRSSKMATVASHLAQEKIEEIISQPYADISSEAKQTLSSPFDAYSRKTEITCFDPNGIGLGPDCPDDTGIKEIKVTVSWGIAGKKMELTTLIGQR